MVDVELREIAAIAETSLSEAADEPALRLENAKLVGPKGRLTLLLKQLPSLPPEERRQVGKEANLVKQRIVALFDARLDALRVEALRAELEGKPFDISLPGRDPRRGGMHPLMRTMYELLDGFISLGFEVVEGPEVESYANNFERLAFPDDHPATDMQDSFFLRGGGSGAEPALKDRRLLRTHTSTVQVRTMMKRKPPLAIVSPGAVYRRDDDPTHSPMFFQLEGLVVDKGIGFAELKGTLELFLRRVFGEQVPVRFRPSYFPFVEPGGEVDVWYTPTGGGPSSARWMEILGCGMVHPAVFEKVGYAAEYEEGYSGFAFGLGIDRITMVKYGIHDIRLLYDNDSRFLSTF